ncbi:hypothetical protein HU200_023783 [Digitaria exilis]|uniref:Uncharacterized protein n=1 Tax=Digitaria exilis TaxID=1010633 RepID=A0A835C5I1_9POAL|nr:hypothetical protein HU200_023783 [Digitaria exilis]
MIQAKKELQNLRVIAKHNKFEFRIFGFSDKPCYEQLFQMKSHLGSTTDITVQDYFKLKKINLEMPHLLCLDVGKENSPCYLPIELCNMVSPQRYKTALSSQQRATFVEKSRLEAKRLMEIVADAIKSDGYVDDPLLSLAGIKIEKQLIRICGHVLSAPTLVVGNGEECIPNEGRWNYNNKMLLNPVRIEHWAVVNFSTDCNMNWIIQRIIDLGRSKGIFMKFPATMVEEDNKVVKYSPAKRVEWMLNKVTKKAPIPPEFLLCLLPERKNCDIYGNGRGREKLYMRWASQCIAPSSNTTDQFFINVLLKINAKLGGLNCKVAFKNDYMIPAITETPTLILGMDVSHGPPGRADVPSVAAVVGSRCWPLLSQYRASIRIQPQKAEMINSLFTPLYNGNDGGMICELLQDFYETSQQRKPSQIIIFRDGVGESQFSQVLSVELNQIIKAFTAMGWDHRPKFTVIVAQKKHHTKFTKADLPENLAHGKHSSA